MPHLLTGVRLLRAVEQQTFIKGGKTSAVEGIKYDFHMGSRILKATYNQPIDIDKFSESEKSAIAIDPGEVVFVLTREELELPNNIVAILSPKRKLAHNGIIVLGGLAVDPMYKGRLLLGLYNVSSTSFPIIPDRKLIAAVFYQLDDSEVDDHSQTMPEPLTDFPDDLVTLIKNYKPIELNALVDRLEQNKQQIENLRAEVVSDKSWKEDFRRSSEDQKQKIDTLIRGLELEKEAREKADDKLTTKLESMSNMFFAGRIVWILLLLLVGGIVGAIVRQYFLAP